MSDETLRLPDEPPVGAIVEAVDDGSIWIHHERPGLYAPDLGRWMMAGTPEPHWTTWRYVMLLTAPGGVRVLPEGEWMDLVMADYGSVTDK